MTSQPQKVWVIPHIAIRAWSASWTQTLRTAIFLPTLKNGPDCYHFHVLDQKCSWNKTPVIMQFFILSSWWNRWGVYMLFAAIILASTYLFHKIQLKRKLAEQEALRLKELDKMKSRLYANITHEFRTPLMLILGQVEQCLKEIPNEGQEQQINKLKSVENNGQRLLHLVNQMLDLRKLEISNVDVNWKHGDIIPLFRFIVESFHSMALSREIELIFESKIPSLMMDYDSDKMFKIVINLLSNALKFTPAGAKVVVFVQQINGEIEFQVKDSGEGISPEELPHIFTRFFQGKSKFQNTGTGIGLTLVKELVELLGGKISVHSILHVGTSFTVRLPIRTDYEANVNLPDSNGFHVFNELDLLISTAELSYVPIKENEIENHEKGKLPLLLIVEDNREVARFIASMLRQDYNLAYAENGEKGIERALELIPDLIISDVMMPVKDGFELLSTLKNDQRSSHIPIILLTAKVEEESRLEGFRRGADAYLDKPFQEEELLVRVRQLLSLRKILQKRYDRLEVPNNANATHSRLVPEFDLPMEDSFLRQVINEISGNVSDPDFGPSKLCQSLTMSSSQLHRKLTAITDKTPVQLIRSLRLAKAKVLLKEHGVSISDVAYDSGFKDPAYFSRIFSKEFGLSPSEFKEMVG